MKRSIFLICLSVLPFWAQAQDHRQETAAAVDTTGIYDARSDELEATVFVADQSGNYLSKAKEVRTEIISAAGLCKMACCNLAESFENSASVTVGYSDAVTGARQIRLLGLSGIYTQMLDENRPVMRGLSAPFGLSYVPGQWLESIQIAKGSSSVINGSESMTGQINLEHRKPTDEKPLFLNAAVMTDTKLDFNVASSLQLNEDWSTVILGHVSGNIIPHDMNKDGFMDDPKLLQFNLANRWLYAAPGGVQVRFGLRALQDSRLGGQFMKVGGKHVCYDPDRFSLDQPEEGQVDPWGSRILNRSVNGYLKVGIPLTPDNSRNFAFVLDYSYQNMDSHFGATSYLADQHSAFANLLFQHEVNEHHRYTAGLSGTFDGYQEDFLRQIRQSVPELATAAFRGHTNLGLAGVFAEYTYKYGEKVTVIAGLRGDWYSRAEGAKIKFVPRLTLKYAPVEALVLRANAGRGLRYSTPLVDNIGVFSSGKSFAGDYRRHLLEDAWTFGGNLTWYLPVGSGTDAYLSVDYFRTQFLQQMLVDYEMDPTSESIHFLASDGRPSFTDNIQLDFSIDPFRNFNVTATFRYTNAKVELPGRGLVEKPMTSRYKGVLNLQYATALRKWIFDFTASVNGPCRVYDFMKGMAQIREKDGKFYSPVYPQLYFQVTRRFKGVDLYAGVENMTAFHQKQLLVNGEDPRTGAFDAGAVWGPIMGVKGHIGVRFTLWKKS